MTYVVHSQRPPHRACVSLLVAVCALPPSQTLEGAAVVTVFFSSMTAWFEDLCHRAVRKTRERGESSAVLLYMAKILKVSRCKSSTVSLKVEQTWRYLGNSVGQAQYSRVSRRRSFVVSLKVEQVWVAIPPPFRWTSKRVLGCRIASDRSWAISLGIWAGAFRRHGNTWSSEY